MGRDKRAALAGKIGCKALSLPNGSKLLSAFVVELGYVDQLSLLLLFSLIG